jgi:dihydrofolate reductase
MTEIVIIAAVAQNGVIGRGAEIPWHIREDFRRFKALTLGYPCIMGDVTFRSLPDGSRPLAGRENVVLTLDPTYHPEGTTVFGAFEDAIAYVRERGASKAFVTGGATIYRLGMAVADVLELTRIHRDYAGDIYFPPVDEAEWELVAREDASSEDRKLGEAVSYSYLTYRRRAATAPVPGTA